MPEAKKYRKKPVVIEAWPVAELLRAASSDWSALPHCVRVAYESGGFGFGTDHISVATLEGTMRANASDWIIKGVNGELYPCKPDIFEKTYEEVADA